MIYMIYYLIFLLHLILDMLTATYCLLLLFSIKEVACISFQNGLAEVKSNSLKCKLKISLQGERF